jgi:hypothetical protein
MASYAYTTAPCAYTAFPYAYTTAPYSTIPLSPRAGEGDIGGEGSALQIRATDYTLTRTPDGGLLLELAGKVRVEYQGRRLEGERLLLDTEAALVRSEEPFRLFAEQGVLTGQRGEYFYGQARGRFEGVQANVLGVYLDAASLEGDLTDFEARAVVVSTCDPFRPPIQVRAGRVRLVRGARLTLRNARLFVYGQPLPQPAAADGARGRDGGGGQPAVACLQRGDGLGRAGAAGVAAGRAHAVAGVGGELPARGSRSARGGRRCAARRRTRAGRPRPAFAL